MTGDVHGAYLHAEKPPDKRILLKMKGEFVNIMCGVNEAHRKNVIEKGKKSFICW